MNNAANNQTFPLFLIILACLIQIMNTQINWRINKLANFQIIPQMSIMLLSDNYKQGFTIKKNTVCFFLDVSKTYLVMINELKDPCQASFRPRQVDFHNEWLVSTASCLTFIYCSGREARGNKAHPLFPDALWESLVQQPSLEELEQTISSFDDNHWKQL